MQYLGTGPIETGSSSHRHEGAGPVGDNCSLALLTGMYIVGRAYSICLFVLYYIALSKFLLHASCDLRVLSGRIGQGLFSAEK